MSYLEKSVGTEEFMISLWDEFDKMMEKEGYNTMVNTDDPNLCRGTICFNDKDKYVPIISLNVWSNTETSIFIEDRNGNSIIHGNTVSINSLKFTKEDSEENIKRRFNNMIDSVLKKYKQYNKQNRLDFDVDEQETERVIW